MAEGEKFKGYQQIPQIALQDVGIIVDASDTTQSPEGSTKYYLKNQLIDFIDKYANKSVAKNYANIPDMLDDQSEQLENNLYLVVDASLDPTVTSGEAYYRYIGTTDEDLGDYSKLSSNEVEIVQEDQPFYVRELRAKEASFSGTLALDDRYVMVTTSNDKIETIIFDAQYSKYLQRAIALFDLDENVMFNIADVKNGINVVAKVKGFSTYESTSFVVAQLETQGIYAVEENTMRVGAELHLFLPIVSEKENVALTLDEVLSEGNTSDTDVVLEDEAAFMASDATDPDKYIKIWAEEGFKPLIDFFENGYKTTLLAHTPNSNRTARIPNGSGTLINKLTVKGQTFTADEFGNVAVVNLYDRLITNASVTGTYTIDMSLAETWKLELTGNTVFSVSNTPPSGFTKTITIHLTPNGNSPTWWVNFDANKTGSIVDGVLNTIVVEYVDGSLTKVQITQDD